MLAGSGRPRKACTQCKGQKVRCSGERPNCKRCARLKRICTYALDISSAHGASPQKEASISSTTHTTNHQEHNYSVSDRTQESPVRVRLAPQEDAFPRAPTQEHYLGIPATLLSSLVDVFFSHIYNASLLLHRRLLLESLANGTTRPHLVLSICAFAGVFYRDANGQSSLLDNGFCTEWAERAGKLVFQEVETPHEDNLATFLNLTLFWYSRGAWRRSYVLKGNAALIVHLLGLGNGGPPGATPLQSEISRRRFWANYLVNCHATESIIIQEPSEATLKLTLPWREEDFETGTPTEPKLSLNSASSNGSIYGEMIRSLTLWQEVWTLVRAPDPNVSARMCAIYNLDARISGWWTRLPAHFRLTSSNISSIPIRVLPKLLLINTFYHQCLLANNASIVPLFSWSTEDDTWPAARRLSAMVAYEHACEASKLFEATLEQYSELSAIPSFVAYAAYSGCAIQIPFIWCTEQAVREKACMNVRTNTRMIHVLAKYWKFAALLEIHLRYLYKLHAKDPILLENEPKYLDTSKLKGIRVHARHARKSILGHNSILWTKESGYAKQGEEVTDLGAEEESSLQTSPEDRTITPTCLRPPFSSTDDHVVLNSAENQPTQQQPLHSSFSTNNPSLATQPDFYAPPVQQVNFFHPFLDPEMLDVFPDGEIMNFEQFDTSPASLSFLDCWLPGMDAGMPGLASSSRDETAQYAPSHGR